MIQLLGVTVRNPALAPNDQPELWRGKGTFAENLIEFAGRVCYRSTDKMGHSSSFIESRIAEGHEDIIEHVVAALRFPYDDDLYHLRNWNRHANTDRIGREFVDVSANLRVWRGVLRMTRFAQWRDEILSVLAPLVPAVFASLLPSTHHPRPIPDWMQIGPTYQGMGDATPVIDGPMRVALLGYLYGDMPDSHCAATFLFEGISRTCTHQLVRHRLASFCLDGDTIVPSFKPRPGHPSKKWTMRQLWAWSNDPKRKGRLKLIRLRGVNEQNELIPVGIKRVINCGVQPVYLVTTESGRKIKATMNHLFSTPDGWKRLSGISIGDAVWANGIEAYKSKDYLTQRYLVENMTRPVLAKELGVSDATLGKWIAKFGLQKSAARRPNRKPGHGKKGMFSEEMKAAISERMTGSNNHRWKGEHIVHSSGRVRANRIYGAVVCERCGGTHRLQRHHRDKNPINNQKDNVIVLCEMCHKSEHFGQVVMTVFKDRVVSIDFAGHVDTYDLEIAHECHNFVANGFVVHNSQESQRYVELNKGGWSAIIPPAIQQDPDASDIMASFWNDAERTYAALRERGHRKEDCRFILPNAAETRIVTTMDFSAWRHFFWLRALDKAAQWEIRKMGQYALTMMHAVAPGRFSDQWQKLEIMKKEENSAYLI